MGQTITDESVTLQITKVTEGSRAHKLNLLPFIHTITLVNDKPVGSSEDVKKEFTKWKQHQIRLQVLDLCTKKIMDLCLEKCVEGESLGINVKVHKGEPYCPTLCVIEVDEDSPAHRASLQAFEDYVIGIEGVYIPNEDAFGYKLYEFKGKECVLFVFNKETNTIRKVAVFLNNDPENLMGATFGTGLLYKIFESDEPIKFVFDDGEYRKILEKKKEENKKERKIQDEKSVADRKKDDSGKQEEDTIKSTLNEIEKVSGQNTGNDVGGVALGEKKDCVLEKIENMKVADGVEQSKDHEKMEKEQRVDGVEQANMEKSEALRKLEQVRKAKEEREKEIKRREEQKREEELNEKKKEEKYRKLEEIRKKEEEQRKKEEIRRREEELNEKKKEEEQRKKEEIRRREEEQRRKEELEKVKREKTEELRKLDEQKRMEGLRRAERIRAEEVKRLGEQQRKEELEKEKKTKTEELRKLKKQKKREEMKKAERINAEEQKRLEEQKREDDLEREKNAKAEELQKLEEREEIEDVRQKKGRKQDENDMKKQSIENEPENGKSTKKENNDEGKKELQVEDVVDGGASDGSNLKNDEILEEPQELKPKRPHDIRDAFNPDSDFDDIDLEETQEYTIIKSNSSPHVSTHDDSVKERSISDPNNFDNVSDTVYDDGESLVYKDGSGFDLELKERLGDKGIEESNSNDVKLKKNCDENELDDLPNEFFVKK
ncbi:hypothetical protein VCUG_00171 [Vavraia culicis subsp. floridensis]|uniref:PDZ GRASP-type domain-containing protein n=1 Tax=Vavraia culicis (isolate floridensis) TaxID=948595 RepID=L2GZ09_VAVCU|nr:uncharacterized protein VCUG_00171 [Vavraia culicis subsp. floridensis]ELA48335.1 hypothetical protein VCUG_00171 [Vavraia culicis subsp. floridensis]